MARHTLDVLYGDVPPGGDVPVKRLYSAAPIVVPSGSCADMIVHHYPELLAGDPAYGPKAEAVAKRTHEVWAHVASGVQGHPLKRNRVSSGMSHNGRIRLAEGTA